MGLYCAEDHKKAFDIYYETRNMKEVERQVGANYNTIHRWRSHDFRCAENCPFHNWDKLIDERDAALQTRASMIEAGNFDVVEHSKAMQDSLTVPAFGEDKPAPLLEYIVTDCEKMAQWVFLRNKVWYDLTGIPIDYGQLKSDEAREQYRCGLHFTNAEKALKALVLIDEQLDILHGVQAPDARDGREHAKKQLSIEELRKLKTVASSSPESLRAMLKVVKNDAKPNSAVG
jgi:hypothetical protein